jgi:hypothetical protein
MEMQDALKVGAIAANCGAQRLYIRTGERGAVATEAIKGGVP